MYNKNLTRFDEGGTHESNPNGGVFQGTAPDGSKNMVEQNETKKGNFIYSNRISLDKDLVHQFNLPAYVANKSVADASKAIDNKFKDRQDKYARETKNTLLDRLSQAQEYLKQREDADAAQANQAMQANSQQVPDMMNGQVPDGMEEYTEQGAQQNPQEEVVEGQSLNPSSPIAAFGGYQVKKFWDGGDAPIGSNLTPAGLVPLQGAQLTAPQVPASAGINSNLSSDENDDNGQRQAKKVVGAAGAAFDLGRTAFGKAAQDTTGQATSASVDKAGMIGSSALKGASAGAAFGPWGAAIGAGVGTIAGVFGAKKAQQAALVNNNNFSINTNRKTSDNYAANGGEIIVDPIQKVAQTTGIGTGPTNNDMHFNTKQIVRYQPGVSNDKLGSGFYLYSKNVTDPGFNVNRDREFIKQSEMKAVQRTPQWNEYMKNEALKKQQGNSFANGGKMNPPNMITQFKKGGIPSGYGADGRFIKPIIEDDNLPSINSVNDIRKYQQSKGIKSTGTMGPLTTSAYEADRLKSPAYNPDLTNLHPAETVNPGSTLESMENYYNSSANNVNNRKTLGNKVANAITDNAGEALRYAPVAMNAFQLAKLKKPGAVNYQTLEGRYKPSYVDEAQMQRIVDQEANNQISALSQSGGSEGALRNAILGAGLNKTKALNDAYANAAAANRATDTQAQTFNRDTDLQNINIRNKAIDEERMDEAAYRGAKSKLLSTMGTDVGHIGKEIADADLASALTGYTRKGKYLVKPDGTRVTPEELARTKNIYNQQNSLPSFKKGDKYVDESGVVKTFKHGGYLNINKKFK